MDFLRLTMSPAELLVRGTLMYWFLFLVLRFVLRRDTGNAGISDILFVVLLGDAAQNGMIGNATSASDGIVLIATLVFWNGSLDFLSWRFRAVEKLVVASRLTLVRDGRMLRRNMRREYISVEELLSELRQHGIDDLADVKRMYLEGDGEISVIKRKDAPGDAMAPPPTPRR